MYVALWGTALEAGTCVGVTLSMGGTLSSSKQASGSPWNVQAEAGVSVRREWSELVRNTHVCWQSRSFCTSRLRLPRTCS